MVKYLQRGTSSKLACFIFGSDVIILLTSVTQVGTSEKNGNVMEESIQQCAL